jgi:peptide-methionine (S)-S-oxide reductase
VSLRPRPFHRIAGVAASMRFALLPAGVALVGCVLVGCEPRSNALAETNSRPISQGAPPAPLLAAAPSPPHVGSDPGHAGAGTPLTAAAGNELAAFAEGCFWGSEDTFRHVDGVVATAVGYAGGHTKRPTYEDVCSHSTGHAETTLVEFDPKRVTYAQLLQDFWESHDPTTPNQQGPDIGDQYRSAIFTFSEAQTSAARLSLAEQQTHTKRKITTEIEPIGPFWKAEDYHQQYDERTGRKSCPIPRHAKAT